MQAQKGCAQLSARRMAWASRRHKQSMNRPQFAPDLGFSGQETSPHVHTALCHLPKPAVDKHSAQASLYSLTSLPMQNKQIVSPYAIISALMSVPEGTSNGSNIV